MEVLSCQEEMGVDLPGEVVQGQEEAGEGEVVVEGGWEEHNLGQAQEGSVFVLVVGQGCLIKWEPLVII